MMTYWYPAVADMIKLLRRHFPGTPVMLGGVYASLCPEAARRQTGPDYVVAGNGLSEAISLISSLTNQDLNGSGEEPLDEWPFAVYDLYPRLNSIALVTSRGCPYRCSFCASRALSRGYEHRDPERVLGEIKTWNRERGIEHFCFYDDALLHRSQGHIKPLLRGIIGEGLRVQLHLPNGLQPRQIDRELAGLLFEAGARTIRLSFESSHEDRQRAMSSKVSNRDLETALTNLEGAGFRREEIGVYVLMGLPDQDFAEVRESVKVATGLGARAHLASFSPVPGTAEWDRAVRCGLWRQDQDLLTTNNSIFPVWRNKYGYQRCQDFIRQIKMEPEGV
jgi:radical SAM superfamily enzyme YgiQ (UPF0313 family)